MTDAMILLPTSIDLISEQVKATTDDGWSSPSPCEGWSALDVLAHATGTLQTAIGSMGGGDSAAAPADAANASVMSEVVTQWKETAAKAADTIVAASSRTSRLRSSAPTACSGLRSTHRRTPAAPRSSWPISDAAVRSLAADDSVS